MTTPHRTLQMALDALDAITDDVDGTGLNTMPSFDKAIDAIAALREALSAPEPEPVALESVHLTRDTRGMCVVRVNGRVAIRDNGDIIDHMATLEWFAAPPAAPAPAAPVPDGWVMVPRGLLRRLIAEALTFDPSLQDKEAIEQAKQLAASPAAPAAPPAAPAPAQPVPLTQDQIADCTRTAHRACDAKGPMTRWSTEFARAIEAAHGITGGKP